MEIREAMRCKKHFILIHETDNRNEHAFDFNDDAKRAPVDLRSLLANHESIPFQRKGYLRQAMLNHVLSSAGYSRYTHLI